MKLLNVEVVFSRNGDIQQARHKPDVVKELDDMPTSYAVLSHRWGEEEMVGIMKMEEEEREAVKQRRGYGKIIKSCEKARKDGYKWLWIDTRCIDKCGNKTDGWATRSEPMLEVKFFNQDWVPLGDKRHPASTLNLITGVPCEVLADGLAKQGFSVA
ncbi:hypothetical protein EDD15DRAFT_2521572 [Pisolithus albus]|nr:hypothetical protein EDD15DRAFT_2521572 [Pisolithus albus]